MHQFNGVFLLFGDLHFTKMEPSTPHISSIPLNIGCFFDFAISSTANVKLQFGQGITAKYSSTEMTEETVSSSSTATTLGTTAQNNEGTFHVALPFSAKLQAQMTPSFVARNFLKLPSTYPRGWSIKFLPN